MYLGGFTISNFSRNKDEGESSCNCSGIKNRPALIKQNSTFYNYTPQSLDIAMTVDNLAYLKRLATNDAIQIVVFTITITNALLFKILKM